MREITTCYREMLCQAHAVMGNLSEIEYLNSRWEASLDEQRSSAVLLDDLLNAHDRLARSEGLYATALVALQRRLRQAESSHRHPGRLPELRRKRSEYARPGVGAAAPPPTRRTSAIGRRSQITAANPQSPHRRNRSTLETVTAAMRRRLLPTAVARRESARSVVADCVIRRAVARRLVDHRAAVLTVVGD